MIALCTTPHICGCKPSTFAAASLVPCDCAPTHRQTCPNYAALCDHLGLKAEPRTGSLSLAEAQQLANLLSRHIDEDEWNAECSAQLTLDRLHDAIDAGLDCR